MKILCHSYAFSPSVGGIESVSEALLAEFVRRGHEVAVITATGECDTIDRAYTVYRNPNRKTQKKLHAWCDIVWQNNLSTRFLWPFLFNKKPKIITTQTWLGGQRGKEGLRVLAKRIFLRMCRNIAISDAVQEHIMLPAIIIGNPYDHSIFIENTTIKRDRDLLYVGRLVTDKGVDLLLESLADLKNEGIHLSIVGDGPEKANLQQYARDNDLDVEFIGVKKGLELSALMNHHKAMVIPSLWAEPFGVVALEGMACGCFILAADSGGLSNAVGPGGVLFERGDKEELKKKLLLLKQNPKKFKINKAEVKQHLEKHTVKHISNRYLRIFERAIEAR